MCRCCSVSYTTGTSRLLSVAFWPIERVESVLEPVWERSASDWLLSSANQCTYREKGKENNAWRCCIHKVTHLALFLLIFRHRLLFDMFLVMNWWLWKPFSFLNDKHRLLLPGAVLPVGSCHNHPGTITSTIPGSVHAHFSMVKSNYCQHYVPPTYPVPDVSIWKLDILKMLFHLDFVLGKERQHHVCSKKAKLLCCHHVGNKSASLCVRGSKWETHDTRPCVSVAPSLSLSLFVLCTLSPAWCQCISRSISVSLSPSFCHPSATYHSVFTLYNLCERESESSESKGGVVVDNVCKFVRDHPVLCNKYTALFCLLLCLFVSFFLSLSLSPKLFFFPENFSKPSPSFICSPSPSSIYPSVHASMPPLADSGVVQRNRE